MNDWFLEGENMLLYVIKVYWDDLSIWVYFNYIRKVFSFRKEEIFLFGIYNIVMYSGDFVDLLFDILCVF